uniref:WxxW domain-containing protein n=1 Tax=Knipowitschia caucasica TaxID=637954 RepID=A0AAV2J1V3_KNICA
MKAQVVIGLIAMMFVESHQRVSAGPACECWTSWLDRDDPDGSEDCELLSLFLEDNPSQVCKNPLDIEARTKPGGISAAGAGEVIHTLSPSVGLICKNDQQKDTCCLDYEVRFRCPPDFCEPVGQI